jgi:hypothetical protein
LGAGAAAARPKAAREIAERMNRCLNFLTSCVCARD